VPSQRTSASNFLNSSSFAFLYASISFFASSLASFTRFVRSILVSYPLLLSPWWSFLTFSSYKTLALQIKLTKPGRSRTHLSEQSSELPSQPIHLSAQVLNIIHAPRPLLQWYLHREGSEYPPNSAQTAYQISFPFSKYNIRTNIPSLKPPYSNQSSGFVGEARYRRRCRWVPRSGGDSFDSLQKQRELQDPCSVTSAFHIYHRTLLATF
jgi:hypothetical protein